ncbi:fibronectin type III domain-containing protein 11 isoform X2 [Heliangelus exortis]
MAGILNESETSSEGTEQSEEQEDNAIWEEYVGRKNIVLQLLHSTLSLQQLQQQQNKVELMKKCYFYLEIEPTHVNLVDEHDVMHHTDILQLIDPFHFQNLKKVGKKQTEILLTLLTELLEQVVRGREELSCYLETNNARTFLSQWHLIEQKLLKLSHYMETLISLELPEKLYVKHRLVSHADLGGLSLPNIRLSLCTKMPLIFDRKESFACTDCAKLKWSTPTPESQHEKYELCFQLVTESQSESGYGRSQVVTSNSCIVQNLQPGRTYEFTIRRSVTETFVLEKWHDSIILKTKPNTSESVDSSACAPVGRGGTNEHPSHFVL